MVTKLTAVKRAAETATAAQRKRDEAIRAAHADGQTIRAIAAAAGLSHGRIHQIVQTTWTTADDARLAELRGLKVDDRTPSQQAELRDLRLREVAEVTRLRKEKKS